MMPEWLSPSLRNYVVVSECPKLESATKVENTNRALKRILKNTVKDNPAIWLRKLDDALWAFRTAYKTPAGTTPYKLIYGKNCHLPFEIEHRAYWTLKNCNPDLIAVVPVLASAPFSAKFLKVLSKEVKNSMESLFSNLEERATTDTTQRKTTALQMHGLFENLFASKKVNASNYDNQHLQKYFKENMGIEPQAYRQKLLYEMDGLGKIIDEQVLHDKELWMKEREVKAIRHIEKSLTKSKMQTEKEMVTEGIALDVSLVYRECTDDNTTLSEQQDKSSSSGYDVDEEKLLVDMVASDIENADIEPSYDTDTEKPVINLYLTKLIMSGSQDEIPPPPPPPSSQTPTQQTPHTVSTIKLPILKKGEYDIWAMKMEHYLAHTDYPIWEVIQNGNGPVSITTDTQGQIKVLPPRTAEEILARERERKARTTLLMALPEDHLAKFHKMTDAKEMWDAIKSRFGGNDESKKMQKLVTNMELDGCYGNKGCSAEGQLIGLIPSIDNSSKIDPIFEEIAGELAHIAPIPPRIVEADFDSNDDTSSDDDDFEDIEYVSLEEVNDEKELIINPTFQESSRVWICQISQEISQKRTRERMSDQEAKDLKAEAREIMPQPSTVNCKKPQVFSDKILIPELDPSPCCARCGTPVDGPSCRGCAFLRKKFDEDLLAYCVENGIFKDFQDTFEPSDDNTNVVNALREPCVVNQDPGVKSSQEPPQIDHNCAHYGYNCPPKVPIISNPEQCNQTINELPQILPNDHPIRNYEAENSFAYVPNPNSFYNSPNFSYPPPQNSPSFSQQYLCCAYCGGPHFDYQCQPINETCYEPNPSYDYSGFNHPQPPQESVYRQEALNKILKEFEELKRDQRMLTELKKQIKEEQTVKEDMSIEEMRHEQQLVDRKIKEITNELGIRRFRGEEIDEEFERDCEIRIHKLKQDFNIWGTMKFEIGEALKTG
ncbi:ribonuclease H-like domain-containing protein [Tanacetum coccineum]|uniref:Ribonuclease H-like domain-containing protein n=1 Tax=Tanacetum coccineum TaxID=301880 RepID=A0ABQ4YXB9_9ASTR